MSIDEARSVVAEFLAELERTSLIPDDEKGPGDWVVITTRLGIAQSTLLLAVTE